MMSCYKCVHECVYKCDDHQYFLKKKIPLFWDTYKIDTHRYQYQNTTASHIENAMYGLFMWVGVQVVLLYWIQLINTNL